MWQSPAVFARPHASSLIWQGCSFAKSFSREMPACHNTFREHGYNKKQCCKQLGMVSPPSLFIFLFAFSLCLSLSLSILLPHGYLDTAVHMFWSLPLTVSVFLPNKIPLLFLSAHISVATRTFDFFLSLFSTKLSCHSYSFFKLHFKGPMCIFTRLKILHNEVFLLP